MSNLDKGLPMVEGGQISLQVFRGFLKRFTNHCIMHNLHITESADDTYGDLPRAVPKRGDPGVPASEGESNTFIASWLKRRALEGEDDFFLHNRKALAALNTACEPNVDLTRALDGITSYADAVGALFVVVRGTASQSVNMARRGR